MHAVYKIRRQSNIAQLLDSFRTFSTSSEGRNNTTGRTVPRKKIKEIVSRKKHGKHVAEAESLNGSIGDTITNDSGGTSTDDSGDTSGGGGYVYSFYGSSHKLESEGLDYPLSLDAESREGYGGRYYVHKSEDLTVELPSVTTGSVCVYVCV